MLIAALTFIAIVVSGCGNDKPGDTQDGGLDADAVTEDAWIDNGPLDCGDPPSPDSNCIRGRLYDFATDSPIPSGVADDIVTFTGDSDFISTKYGTNSNFGRVDPNGRFVTWTNDVDDVCLTQIIGANGYRNDTINCYGLPLAGKGRDFEYRLYQLGESLYQTWIDIYPGTASISDDGPFVSATCRNIDYSLHASGTFNWNYTPTSPFNVSLWVFNTQLTDFENAGDFSGTMPESAAFIFWLDLGVGGNPQDGMDISLYCQDDTWGAAIPYQLFRRSDIESNEMRFVFLNALQM